METKKLVLDYLDNNSVKYTEYKHEAVFTVEESKKIDSKIPGLHTKNLFLRDEKSETYFLVVLPAEKRANLKKIAKIVDVKRLTFGKPEKLKEYLDLTPGSVSPFGLINDKNNKVALLLDKEVANAKKVCFHPNINTATLVLEQQDFEKYLNSSCNKVIIENL